jgi:hypothetical protein
MYEGMLMFGVVFIAAICSGTLSRRAMRWTTAPLQAFVFVVFAVYFVCSGPKA